MIAEAIEILDNRLTFLIKPQYLGPEVSEDYSTWSDNGVYGLSQQRIFEMLNDNMGMPDLLEHLKKLACDALGVLFVLEAVRSKCLSDF